MKLIRVWQTVRDLYLTLRIDDGFVARDLPLFQQPDHLGHFGAGNHVVISASPGLHSGCRGAISVALIQMVGLGCRLGFESVRRLVGGAGCALIIRRRLVLVLVN